MGLQSDKSVSNVSPIRFVCWSLIRHVGLRPSMLISDEVSNESPIRHVGLQWVSDQACRSPMGLRSGMLVSDEARRSQIGLRSGMSVSDGSPIRHVGLVGFRSGMLVSDGSPGERSPIGLR